MLMLPLVLIIGQFRSAAVFAAALIVALIGLRQFWYKKLPPTADACSSSGNKPGRPAV
jgi:hypothetical protein